MLAGPEVRCGYLRHQLEGFRRLGAAITHVVDRRRPGFVAAFSRRQPRREGIRSTAAG
jgi:hypothetical protein